MPIIYMLIYQCFKTWTSFLIAAIVNAFVFSFILEPLFLWLHIYEPYLWKYTYSFIAPFLTFQKAQYRAVSGMLTKKITLI